MSDIVKILPYSADLNETIKKTELHTLFVMSESLAHRFEIEIWSGGKAADLTGCTVTGYFTNFKEKTMITVPGKAEDGRAIVTLNKPCYTLHGQFVLIIQVKTGDVDTAVFHGEGFMRTNTAEKIVFDDYVIYDINTLLSQISSMKTATDRANTAAAKAEALTINASGLAGDSNKLGGQLPSYYATAAQAAQLLQQFTTLGLDSATVYDLSGSLLNGWTEITGGAGVRIVKFGKIAFMSMMIKNEALPKAGTPIINTEPYFKPKDKAVFVWCYDRSVGTVDGTAYINFSSLYFHQNPKNFTPGNGVYLFALWPTN